MISPCDDDDDDVSRPGLLTRNERLVGYRYEVRVRQAQ